MTRRFLLILGLLGSSLSAQQGPIQLRIVLPENPAMEGPSTSVAHALSDDQTRELLQQGFPTRLHFRVELWRKSGWFYNPVGAEEWDDLVSYDPAARTYTYKFVRGKQRLSVSGVASLDSAEALVDEPTKNAIHPDRPGRYYYNAAVDVQPLSVSDMDAALDWVQGPVKHRQNIATAFLKGFETIFSRILGGGARHFEHASGIFDVP